MHKGLARKGLPHGRRGGWMGSRCFGLRNTFYLCGGTESALRSEGHERPFWGRLRGAGRPYRLDTRAVACVSRSCATCKERAPHDEAAGRFPGAAAREKTPRRLREI
ncbi:unnamed protein product [marine sediment metagenome]|uniref:Uncharacterized protein n=1 Tax=marine sediment metagenome TaxID=412755 RepID=X1IAH2_9ZZZZ